MKPSSTDVLANERTFLAYVRTALAFIGFGFVIARFSLFMREFAVIAHTTVTQTSLSTAFGTAMAVFGIVIAAMGAWRYAATDRALHAGEVRGLSSAVGYVVAIVVGAIGVVVAFALVSYS
ncbi:MAG: YidH family protein [Vulcanimicrobiaceae bacterium]